MYHHGRLHAYGRPGEIFIRTVAAFNTAAQVWLQHIPITGAGDNTLMESLPLAGLAVCHAGCQRQLCNAFQYSGQFQGTIDSDGIPQVSIFS